MAYAGTLSLSVTGTLTPDTANDLESQQSSIAYNPNFTITNGTGANQANTVFSDTRTLTASASETIDLNGGTLEDRVCDPINLTALKFLVIRSHAANPGDLLVGPNSSNGFAAPFNAAGDRIRVKPGGMLVLVAPDATGYAVTSSTDLLYIENGSGAGSATYDIVFSGVDA